tara:strand:+ start:4662 stop:6575 length:1914 start_codon:yes stop_codon:yes gene_type:complete
MDYKLLTVQGITKICDDRIIQDHNGNISPLQWIDFQLRWLLYVLGHNKYDTNIHKWPDLENTILTRDQIFRLLEDEYGSENNRVIIPLENTKHLNHQEAIKMGFHREEEVSNFFNIHLGLKCNFELIYNNNRTLISEPEEKQYFSKYSLDEMSDLDFKKLYFPNTDTSITNIKSVDDSNKTDFPYGVLKWKSNSCYADAIIYILFIRMMKNKESYLYKHLMNFNYTGENIGPNNEHCGETIQTESGIVFVKDSSEENIVKLNNIIIKFREVVTNLEQNISFYITDFFKILTTCGNNDSIKWSKGDTEASEEFFRYLIDIINYNIPPRIPLQEGNSNTNRINAYYFKKDNLNIDRIRDILQLDSDFEFNMDITDAEGNFLYDYKELFTPNPPSPIQIMRISPDILKQYYKKITVDTVAPSAYAIDPTKYKIHPITNLIYTKSNYRKARTEMRNLIINITDLLLLKEITDKREVLTPTYIITDKSYSSNNTHYYKLTDREDESKHYPLSELPENIGFEYSGIVNEYTLTSQSEDIFIIIDRLVYTGLGEERLAIQIQPLEIITVEGTDYQLNGIVYWKDNHYMSIFHYNNKYYHYDDIGTKNINEFESFDKMLQYNMQSGSGILLKNSSIYHYIKINNE